MQPHFSQDVCTEIMTNKDGKGKWSDLPCSTQLNFVCSVSKSPNIPHSPPTESPLGCADDFVTSVPGQACFKLYTDPMAYTAAKDICQCKLLHMNIAKMLI